MMLLSEQNQYHIYINGKHVCDVWADDEINALILGHRELAVKEATRRLGTYCISAEEKVETLELPRWVARIVELLRYRNGGDDWGKNYCCKLAH